MFFLKRLKRVVRTYSSLKGPQNEYSRYKADARTLVKKQLEFFNNLYKFEYKRISIKNQGTRWGSCSGTGNLNFHYKIVLLPEKLSSYIIVHELCHLKQFDHSAKFWELVAQAIPDYRELRRELKSGKYTSPKNIQ